MYRQTRTVLVIRLHICQPCVRTHHMYELCVVKLSENGEIVPARTFV